jgi:hypothetical protein
MDEKCGKEQGPRKDIPWKSTSGVRVIPSIGQLFLGMYGIGLPVIGVEFAQHFLCIYD